MSATMETVSTEQSTTTGTGPETSDSTDTTTQVAEVVEDDGSDSEEDDDDGLLVSLREHFSGMATMSALFLEGVNELNEVAKNQANNEGAKSPHATTPMLVLQTRTSSLKASLTQQSEQFAELERKPKVPPVATLKDDLENTYKANVEVAGQLADDARKLGVTALKGDAPGVADEWLSAGDKLHQAKTSPVKMPFAENRGLIAESIDEYWLSLGKKDVPGFVIKAAEATKEIVFAVSKGASEAAKEIVGGVFGILSGLVGIVIGIIGWRKANRNEKLLKELGVRVKDDELKRLVGLSVLRVDDERADAIKEVVMGLGGIAVGIAAVVLAGLGPAGLIIGASMAAAGLLYTGVKWLIGYLRKSGKIKALALAHIEGWVNTVSKPGDMGDAEPRALLEQHDPALFADSVAAATQRFNKGKDKSYRDSLTTTLTDTAPFSRKKTFFETLIASIKEMTDRNRAATARRLLSSYLDDKPSVRAQLEVYFITLGLKPATIDADIAAKKEQRAVDRIATKLEAKE